MNVSFFYKEAKTKIDFCLLIILQQWKTLSSLITSELFLTISFPLAHTSSYKPNPSRFSSGITWESFFSFHIHSSLFCRHYKLPIECLYCVLASLIWTFQILIYNWRKISYKNCFYYSAFFSQELNGSFLLSVIVYVKFWAWSSRSSNSYFHVSPSNHF